jgi:ABC-type sugar transport system ATPase subunit
MRMNETGRRIEAVSAIETAKSASVIACLSLAEGLGGAPVLEPISVTFRSRHVDVLAGENGAGQSILLKGISGRFQPDESISIVCDAGILGSSAASPRRWRVNKRKF